MITLSGDNEDPQNSINRKCQYNERNARDDHLSLTYEQPWQNQLCDMATGLRQV